MTIQDISIQNLGSIRSYDAAFAPELNLIDSRYTDEIATAIAFLLCNTPAIPEHWVQEDTRISAAVLLEHTPYRVCVTPVSGRLQLSVADPTGSDATAQYQYALKHCAEQDEIESFDGQDKTVPLRLYGYYRREVWDQLSCRTGRLADTKAFRKYLFCYIRHFQPESIHCQKNYQAALDAQGKFQVFHPEASGKIHLSETEQRLFHYICFLNTAEFWAGFEEIRDIHYEKKPLLIQNFLEYLDESVNIGKLITRTKKLKRQVMVLCNRRGVYCE